MTEQIETAIAIQNPTRMQKLLASLTALEQAMSYDPHEHTDAMIRHLWQKVEKLETRLTELEGPVKPDPSA